MRDANLLLLILHYFFFSFIPNLIHFSIVSIYFIEKNSSIFYFPNLLFRLEYNFNAFKNSLSSKSGK